ncbi:hypothetical protein RJ639_005897 [Escallonia herrerae]|uniref:Cytochrome P450 n=1 Tax=Escallonia herrerae TaxID=1293975 RepID=A0AA88VZ81_9ASTE|nr:hypothetical protein RJ639_005897 [Escallonia herrerae]
MKSVLFEMMLNVMMRMMAGKRYYGERAEETRRFRDLVTETFTVNGATNLADFLPVVRWMGVGGMEKRLVALQVKRDAFAQGLVDERRGRGGGGEEAEGRNKTMLEVLLGLQAEEPEYYTDEIIKGIMLLRILLSLANLLAAGIDASIATMEWTLSLLLNNPDHLKKEQAEMDKYVRQDRLVEVSDIAHLPYLRCIMNKASRMPSTGPHESSQECTVEGYRIPADTMLLVNMWAIQNDPKIWEDPRKFKPERFEGLEGSRDGFKFVQFGYGRRLCPGESLAMRVVGLALGSLLQCFEWERPGKEMVDMTEGPGLITPKVQPLVAKCRPRPRMVKLLSQI